MILLAMNIESQGMNKQDQCYPGYSLVLEEIWGEDNSPRRFGIAKYIKKRNPMASQDTIRFNYNPLIAYLVQTMKVIHPKSKF